MSKFDVDRLRRHAREYATGRVLIKDAADEIEQLRRKCEDRTAALVHACGLAQSATLPSLDSLNKWRVTLGWGKLPEDFEYE